MSFFSNNAAASGPPASKPLFGGTSAATAGGSGGIFGSKPTTQLSGGLFSATTNTSQPATGFGGLNASAASKPTTTPLFGGAQGSQPAGTTQAPASTLFAVSAAQPAASQPVFGGNLFSAKPAQPASTGISFGATAASAAQPNATQPATAGSSFSGFGGFGGAAQTSQPAAATGGLFSGGQTSQPASQSAPAGGLFAPTQTTQPTTAAPSFSLFSNAASSAAPASSAPASSAPATTGLPTLNLFGKPPAATTQPAAGGSLFAASAQAPKTGSILGLGGFGASTTNAAPAAPTATTQGGTVSLFGVPQPLPGSQASSSILPDPKPLFASLGPTGLGTQPQQQQQQPQQVVPGVKIDLSNIKATTRFFELHDDIQREIEAIDSFIQTQIQLFTQCSVFMPEHGNHVQSIPADVVFLQNKYDTVTQALDRDTADISAVKDAVQIDIDNARSTFAAVENLRLPTQFQQSGMWSGGASDSDFEDTNLISYFEKRANEQDVRLQKYNEQVLEIEAHLRTVEGSAVDQTEKLLRRRAGQDTSKERVLELVGAMRGFEDAVFRVASKVGEAREGVIECTMGSISGNNTAGRSTNGRLGR